MSSVLSAASLGQLSNTPRAAPATPVTAILGAMTLEVETLDKELTNKKERTIQEIRFTTGRLKGRRVVLAHSGIGKVNAAMTAALLVEQFRPTHLLFTGIAGGLNPDLRPGDVVIGAKTAYHDYGVWTPGGFQVGRTKDPFTGKLNPLCFPADAGLLRVAEKAAADLKLAPVKTATGERTPRVVTGIIVTADVYRADGRQRPCPGRRPITEFREHVRRSISQARVAASTSSTIPADRCGKRRRLAACAAPARAELQDSQLRRCPSVDDVRRHSDLPQFSFKRPILHGKDDCAPG